MYEYICTVLCTPPGAKLTDKCHGRDHKINKYPHYLS